jgi:hypothetical protein
MYLHGARSGVEPETLVIDGGAATLDGGMLNDRLKWRNFIGSSQQILNY